MHIIHITNFESLLTVARQQPEPQRLLFVFVKAELPDDATEEEAKNFKEGEGGALQPVMCVDKDIEDLTTFADLVAESEEMGQDWDVVLLAGLSGKNGVPPTAEDAESPLKNMLNTIQSGGDISSFMGLDRKGLPIKFG